VSTLSPQDLGGERADGSTGAPGGRLMVYGATGYTGERIARRAVSLGVDVVIAGRNAPRLTDLATELHVEHVVVAVHDQVALQSALRDIDCLLNVAGPFTDTAAPLLTACLATGTHYLDTTAEHGVFAASAARSREAEEAGIMVMSGVGWDVVPSDCLAVHTAARVTDPVGLRIGLKVSGDVSPGSSASAAGIADVGNLVRRSDVLTALPAPVTARFDFGAGPEEAVQVPMGDLITAWHCLHVPDIDVFASIDVTPVERGAELSVQARYQAVAEVTGVDGSVATSRIDTVNGYTYTQHSAVEVARRVLAGEAVPGFQTPAAVWGPELATSVAGTHLVDL